MRKVDMKNVNLSGTAIIRIYYRLKPRLETVINSYYRGTTQINIFHVHFTHVLSYTPY